MASMSSEGWESVVSDAPKIDSALLMALLDESHLDDTEDERLRCVIQSLEAEIEPSAVDNGNLVESGCSNYGDCMDCGQEDVGLEDGDDCSRSTCHADDPFDWVDMDLAPNSQCDDIGNWYSDTCNVDVGLVEFGDVRDYTPFYYGDSSIEHTHIPLWQETYDFNMYL